MTTVTAAQVEAAETKADLEALAKAMGQPFNRKKGVETSRAELLEALEEAAAQPDPVADAAAETAAEVGQQTPSEVAGAASTEEAPVEAAPAAPAPEAPQKPTGKTRLIKNPKTGRTMAWTPALAKRKDLKEV